MPKKIARSRFDTTHNVQDKTGDSKSDSLHGLTQAEVAQRIEDGLSNRAPHQTSRSVWSIVRNNLFTYFNMIVLGSSALLLALGQWRDALFGFAAMANVLIGIWQEYHAKRLLDQLALLHTPHVHVVREGMKQNIHLDDVVRDDVIMLETGDQVPADVIILQSDGLEANESLLTGEVDPVAKEAGDQALSGSIVVAGSAYARAQHVGMTSFASRLTADARRFSLVHSELRSSINRILRWISFALIPVGLIVINGQIQSVGGWQELVQQHLWIPVLTGVVASIVSMIPLGLVLITSIAFALGAVKLADRNVLVQELAAVEGLARADIVCFDKTGTLTQGEIVFDTVKAIHPTSMLDWRAVLGWFASQENSSATISALAREFPVTVQLDSLSNIPFSSLRKWSEVSIESGNSAGSWVLGAPENIINIDDPINRQVAEYIKNTTQAGRRVLLLAHAHKVSPTFHHSSIVVSSYSPVAIIALKETVRRDVADTLTYFQEQGVSLRLFSGDNPRTVATIAREVGMVFDGEGYDARLLPADIGQMADILDTQIVFGRVSPDQKKDMVRALQLHGHTVAMVGDGVNDVMAIKQADIGVAMGAGAIATRSVARIVLLDNDFSQFPQVIAAGRQVITNIERVALLFLSKTVYIMILSIVFGLLLWGFPLLPRQLAVVDGLTLGIPAFFLALMAGTKRYEPDFLRRTLRIIIPIGVTIGVLIIALNTYIHVTGPYDVKVQGATLTIALTLLGLWTLVVLSRPLDRWRILLIVSMYMTLAIVFAVPFIRDFFEFALPSGNLLSVLVLTVFLGCIVLNFLIRWLQRRGRQAHVSLGNK